jgi:hypothetical protein
MKNMNVAAMDPMIEGYLSYLDKVGRKTPRTIIDVRCTLRRAIARFEAVRPGVESDEPRAGNGFETWEGKVVRLRRVRSQGNGISRRFVFKNQFTRLCVMLGER